MERRPGARAASGIAYPPSVKNVLSFAYARIRQAPAREYLHDDRRLIGNRGPLGNPALGVAPLMSHEASIRHLLSAGGERRGPAPYPAAFS